MLAHVWGKAREGDGQRWVTGLGFTRHLTQGSTSWQQAWVKHNTSVCVFVCTSARVTFCVSTCVHVIAHVCSVHECAHMLCVHSCVHAPVCAFVCTHVCVCSENRPAHAHWPLLMPSFLFIYPCQFPKFSPKNVNGSVISLTQCMFFF